MDAMAALKSVQEIVLPGNISKLEHNSLLKVEVLGSMVMKENFKMSFKMMVATQL